MKVGIMITNGGPHPPEKWAEQSAEHIADAVQIGDNYAQRDEALQAKNVLREKVREALVGQHDRVQKHERGQLTVRGDDHLSTRLDPIPHVEEALAAVNDAISGSVFANHYAKPDTQQYVRNVLASHFATAMDIERQHHAARQQRGAQ